MTRVQRYYLLAAGLLVGLEVLIALFVRDAWLRPYGGDVLATILVYCLLRAITRGRPRQMLGVALLISYAIELGQYLQFAQYLGVQRYPVARVVLGSTFSGSDLLAYTAGAALVLIIERFVQQKHTTKSST